MRVPLSWLTEHVQRDRQTDEQLINALIGVGVEVDEVSTLDRITGPLVVGRVVEIEELTEFKKPIRYCQVDVRDTADISGGQSLQPTRGIICGAQNFAVDDLVVVALPGAVLPGDFQISARKTYGHISDGMICSAAELGLGEDHSGIIVLTGTDAQPGDDARDVLGLDDTVVDLVPTPDRGYALSIRGLARELSCALGLPFVDPASAPVPDAEGDAWPVTVEDAEACPRFVARRVSDVDPDAPSPWWIKRRLMLAGIRSISLAVDVTNYVMLELGQPLHAFDAAKVQGTLVVRRAKAGEKLTTLDDVSRKLSDDDIVICDDTGVVSLAGTMGGASTEIGTGSTDVLLEGAHWDPASISRTARRHKLFSEAAKRFERYTDPAVAPAAVELAAQLLVDHGGGTVFAGRTDVGGVPAQPSITMPLALPDQTAGVKYERGVTAERLAQVGCSVTIDTDQDGTALVVATPPTWRNDLLQPADLVEEVLRLEGYDTIPSELPPVAAGAGLTASQRSRRSVARALAENGYVEVTPMPFVAPDVWDSFGLDADDERRRTATVLNPLEADRNAMATTLLPGLVEALQRNVSRGMRDLALFQIGRVVLPAADAPAVPDPGVDGRPSDAELAALEESVPRQPVHVGAALAGQRRRGGWWGAGEDACWADAVEAARVVASAAGVPVTVAAAERAPWHPGRCARLSTSDGVVGYAGELHPKVCEALGLPARTSAMELDLDAVGVADLRPAPSVASYPPVLLDVALVADASVPAAGIAAALRDGGGELLEDVALFDVFSGKQVGEGKRSLAFKLRFRDPDRTLTVDEATDARDAAVAVATERFGAVLRS